ncbi:sensor histidine kinase [Pseudoalteromonas umbrosa]|uniref:sensor histidine kinase n=1 Tax=Pseudoalteromonas umbrosa TaxID=3048489 RepID=UPI0024C21576|nr:HAMP domain-containing sensor histidine kinase [Pseudoalteromonas sp. B95]MDK1288024.1 HAMP domain-containing sensor histidine kinase [Pseudoalteromonas sp. B95]
MNNLLSRTLLLKSLLISIACTAGFMTIFFIASIFKLAHLSSEQQHELVDYIEEVQSLYDEDGLQTMLTELDLESKPIWNKKQSIERLSDHESIFSITQGNTLLVGSEVDIPFEAKPIWSYLDFDNGHEIKVLVYSKVLEDTLLLKVAQPNSYESGLASGVLVNVGMFSSFLIFIVAFLISYFASFRSQRTLLDIKKQMHIISNSPDSSRLSVKSKTTMPSEFASYTNEMLDKISALHGTTKTMSTGIAHDLKTPLSRVVNRLQSMRQDITDTQAIELHINKASQDLNAVISTFNNLVRLNAIESGKHKQKFELVNLSELVNDLALSYEPVFEDSGRKFSHSAVDNVICFGETDLLNQLLCNLLENALEYSSADANVWIRLQSHTSGALLQVGDDGPGIHLDDQPHVFERFFRADVSRSKPGNGLGLSIVKAICDVHDAKLVLLPNQFGAVFNIEIPVSSTPL